MDTGATVEERLALIKGEMPQTYRSIQAKAQEIGKSAFGLVRRGLRGEANCFWACERGQVVGTPFAGHEIERDVARNMVSYGCTFVCIWGQQATESVNGAD